MSRVKGTSLLLIDWQEKLIHAMDEDERVAATRNAALLIKAASAVDLPILATEQYPAGLGPTVLELRVLLPKETTRVAKTAFSAIEVPEINDAFQALGIQHVVLLGMEAHICVWQTARALLAAGLKVTVVADAVLSRTAQNREIALGLMREAGATVSSTEAVVFDWVGDAKHPAFKTISRLVR
jgi:nicotinamidase-related amidase